ncbi:MAG: hypothetical protein HRT70_10675 [Flavobacteriaceae bacterium]|nr:hypothetical protein [Flavobacteriaceae bacterium]
MKKSIFTIAILLMGLAASAQWTDNGDKLTTTDKVGVGTANPSHKLHVNGMSRVNGHLYFSGKVIRKIFNQNNNKAGLALYGGGNSLLKSLSALELNPDQLGTTRLFGRRLSFFTGNARGINGGTEQLSILENGNVGIGTTNPSQKLDVAGSINFTGNLLHNGNIIDFSTGGGSSPWIQNGNNISYLTGSVGVGVVNTAADTPLKVEKGNTIFQTRNASSEAQLFLGHKGSGNATLYLDASSGDGIGLDYGALSQKNDLSMELLNNAAKPIYFKTHRTTRMTISGAGHVGIGTTNPSEKLEVARHIKITGADLEINNASRRGSATGSRRRALVHESGDRLAINYNGDYTGGVYFGSSVGIGTTNPGAWKLAVNGSVRAKEIKVETGWADFVFYDDYTLPTLEEVENHIKAKGHLKDIPSAAEVGANGILLGEMNSKLLQKIEELTLYVIAQDKENKSQQADIEALKQMNAKLVESIKMLKE